MLKDSAFEELANVIKTVLKDQIYIAPKVGFTVTDYVTEGAASEPLVRPRLTDRAESVPSEEGPTVRSTPSASDFLELCR